MTGGSTVLPPAIRTRSPLTAELLKEPMACLIETGPQPGSIRKIDDRGGRIAKVTAHNGWSGPVTTGQQ